MENRLFFVYTWLNSFNILFSKTQKMYFISSHFFGKNEGRLKPCIAWPRALRGGALVCWWDKHGVGFGWRKFGYQRWRTLFSRSASKAFRKRRQQLKKCGSRQWKPWDKLKNGWTKQTEWFQQRKAGNVQEMLLDACKRKQKKRWHWKETKLKWESRKRQEDLV